MTKYLGHLPEDTPVRWHQLPTWPAGCMYCWIRAGAHLSAGCVPHELPTNPLCLLSSQLRILEIGLGCDMPEEWGGVGNSLLLWRRLFPRAAISFIEIDAQCAEKLRTDIEATGGRLYIGPQAEPATVAPVLTDAASLGPFDLIVDDGGHHPVHQRLSLELLWPALRPFGLYVIEDLLTTYFHGYETLGAAPGSSMPFLTAALGALQCRTAATAGEVDPAWRAYCQQNSTVPQLVKKEFLSIDCAAEICAIMKHATPPPLATVL
ncbi:hypothetical protein ABPG75_005441 [Micractinium tetrahymenae]